MTSTRRDFGKGNLLPLNCLLWCLLLMPLSGMAAEGDAAKPGSDSVARAIFTSGIVDREPVDDLTTVPTSLDRVYFFSDLRNLEGQIITHRWEYNGKVMAEVKFQVGGPRWRVYSSKNLLPEWSGQWTVIVTDENDWPIKASVFEYTRADTQQ